MALTAFIIKSIYMAKNNKEIGNLGENIACKYLVKNNFLIIDRNYRKKWGEIDIVAIKKGILHFFEVKSINNNRTYKPEYNVHNIKQRKIKRMIETYLIYKGIDREVHLMFHVLSIYLNHEKRLAKVSFIENVIL